MSANTEQFDVCLFMQLFKQRMIQWERTVTDRLQSWLSDQQPQANTYLEMSLQAKLGVLEENQDKLTRAEPTEEKTVIVLATQATSTIQGEYLIYDVDLGGGGKILEADLLSPLGLKIKGKEEGLLRWGKDFTAEVTSLAGKQLPFENGQD